MSHQGGSRYLEKGVNQNLMAHVKALIGGVISLGML